MKNESKNEKLNKVWKMLVKLKQKDKEMEQKRKDKGQKKSGQSSQGSTIQIIVVSKGGQSLWREEKQRCNTRKYHITQDMSF